MPPADGAHAKFVGRASQRGTRKRCSKAPERASYIFLLLGEGSFITPSISNTDSCYMQNSVSSSLVLLGFQKSPQQRRRSGPIYEALSLQELAQMFILSLRELKLSVEVFSICDWAHNRGKDRNSSVKFSNILYSIKIIFRIVINLPVA